MVFDNSNMRIKQVFNDIFKLSLMWNSEVLFVHKMNAIAYKTKQKIAP